ncbi:MAG: FHA domain-containing protein [Burkholderiales bacterium]|nr:FHA domain-containing protein [Phycisphaerae bacterium]
MASTASTQPSDGAARLIPLGSHAGVKPIPLNRPALVIGSRKEAVRLHLESSTVSKAHCVMILHEWGCSIHDLGSRTQTIVNGQAVIDADLKDGDKIRIGRFEFQYGAPNYVYGSPQPIPSSELAVSTLTDPLPLTKRVIQIGRRTGSDLQFADNAVSNIHAIIFARNGRRYVRDLASRTGTWLDGQLIHQEELLHGAVLKIGPAEIVYRETAVDSLSLAARALLPVSLPPAMTPEPPQISAEVDEPEPIPALDLLDLAATESEAAEAKLPGDEALPTDELENQIDDDALTALRKGWHGVSRVPTTTDAAEEIVLAPALSDLPLDESLPAGSPLDESSEPRSTRPLVPEPLPSAPVSVEALDDVAPLEVEAEPDAVIDLDVIASTEEPAAVDEPELDAPAMGEARTEEPAVIDESLEEVPLELDLDDLLPMPVVDEAPAEEPVSEPIADITAPGQVEVAHELPADEIELADAEKIDDAPLDLDDILGLTPDASDEPATSAALPPLLDVTDDDGAIDLDELAPPPVAGSLAEPDLGLETDDVGTDAIEEAVDVVDEVRGIEPAEPPVIGAEIPVPEALPELSVATEAPEDDAIPTADAAKDVVPQTLSAETIDHGEFLAEDDVLDDLSDTPYLPVLLADEADDDTETTPEESERTARENSTATLSPESDAGVEVAPVFDSASPELQLGGPEPVTVDLADLNTPPTFNADWPPLRQDEPVEVPDFSPASVDLDLPQKVEANDRPVLEYDAVDLSEETVDEPKNENEDTAFAIGLDELDPFDLDDDLADQAEPAPPALGVNDEIIEEAVSQPSPVISDPVGAWNDESDDDVDIASIMEELGIARDEPDAAIDDGVGDGMDPITARESELVAEARGVEADIDDLLETDQSGSLADLIPKGPPLLGGFFGSQSQGLMLGGSPMVNLNAPPKAPNPPVKPPAAPTAEPVGRFADDDDDAPAPAGNKPPAERRRPLRVGFSSAGANPASPSLNSPFAAPGKTISDVLIGRRAAASVDVFASPSPTAEDLLSDHPPADGAQGSDDSQPPVAEASASSALTPEQQEILRTADRYRPRGAVRPIGASDEVNETAPADQPPEPQDIAVLRRTRLHRVFLCMAIMLPLAAGAWLGAWWFVPATSKLDAAVTFNGLDRLSDKDAATFRALQEDYLQDQSTHEEAKNLLDQSVRDHGFLTSATTIQKVLESDPAIAWPPKPGNARHLVVQSSDKEADVARLRALAAALIKANSDRVSRAQELRKNIEEDRANINRRKERVDALKDQLQALTVLGETRPDDTAISKVVDRSKAIETELKTVRGQRMDAEAMIEVIKRKPFTELAQLPDEQFIKADENLVSLTARLDDLRKQNEAARAEVDARLAAARKSLDAVIQQFQTDLDSAQKVQNGPAELIRYVESAKRIFAQTRQLTDDLLHRQEQQHTRLSELKTRLSDRIEAHARNTLETDDKLKSLNNELAMLTRQQNAAVAEGLVDEAKTLSLKMELIRSLISGREELVKHDPVHAETISSLQSIIEQTEKSIQEDRKHINEALTKSQEEFAKTSPAVAQLPADQKQLAMSIEQRMAAISEARLAYSKTADAADVENAKRDAAAKEKMNAVQNEIQTRKAVVLTAARDEQARIAEEARKKQISEKATALVSLQQSEATLQTRLDATMAEHQKMQEQRRRLVETEQERSEKLAQRNQLELEMRQYRAAIIPKESQLASLVIPEEKFELQSYDNPDRRPLFASAAAGSVVALMLIPIVWNLRLLSRDSHATLARREPPRVNGFHPVMPANGSGEPAVNGNHSRAEPIAVET